MDHLAQHKLPPHIAYTQALNCPIKFNLSHSCGQAISINTLLTHSENGVHENQHKNQYLDQYSIPKNENSFKHSLLSTPLEYASVKGSSTLQNAIVNLHQKINPQSDLNNVKVVTFSGAQEALASIYRSLLKQGDEVVVFTPSYPSLTRMVEPLGATLVTIPMIVDKASVSWQFDIEQLFRVVNVNTKLIVLNAPHNPTGACLSEQQQQQVLRLAQQFGCYLLSDDVSQASHYQLASVHSAIDQPNIEQSNSVSMDLSALSHPFFDYEKTVSVGVMSKSFGLGGVRIGWALTKDEQLSNALLGQKAQASICTSLTDEVLATIALNHADKIIGDINTIAKQNIALFNDFLREFDHLFSWCPPQAGLLALAHYHGDMPVREWATQLAKKTGILLLPGELFDVSETKAEDKNNTFRIGLGQASFQQGLLVLAKYLRECR